MARNSWLGLLLVGSFGIAAGLAWGPLWGQSTRPPLGPAASDLIVLRGGTGPAGQQIVVIDSTNRVMGSYLVNTQSGEIALKSVRNFAWDLYLEDFNAAQPAPREIKDLLPRD